MNYNSNILYKYVALDIGESIVITSTLKFTNPLKFNDPFDCNILRLKFDLTTIDPVVKAEVSFLREKFGNDPRVTDELLQTGYEKGQIDKIKKSSVCCFSHIPDNLLMWAHYSNKHFGACLIFDNSVADKFISVPDTRLTEGTVDYAPFTIINYLENKVEGIKKLFTTKSIDWEYENEYRIIILEQEGLVRFNPKFLTGIIFGMNAGDDEIKRFQNACSREKIDLSYKKAIKDRDKLKIIDLV